VRLQRIFRAHHGGRFEVRERVCRNNPALRDCGHSGPMLRKIDTALKSPNDIEEGAVFTGEDERYLVSPRSVVLLLNTP
jgi:hypothetical protein